MKTKWCDNYVKEYREILGMTQTELAQKCATSQNTICSIEHGQIPSVVLGIQLAEVLKVPITDLFVF